MIHQECKRCARLQHQNQELRSAIKYFLGGAFHKLFLKAGVYPNRDSYWQEVKRYLRHSSGGQRLLAALGDELTKEQ
jgi:hypothetical protein